MAPARPPDSGRRNPDGGVGLYVHVPFCASRCAYCTFVTSTDSSLIPRTMAAVVAEVERLAAGRRRALASLYLGGGTPSVVGQVELRAVFAAIHDRFALGPNAEVTLEANPDDVSGAKVRLWRTLGVNRVSLGVQAFKDPVLETLSRRHSAEDARRASWLVKEAGMGLSIDLMLGLPRLSEGDLGDTLEEVAALGPEHVSIYLLELDKPHTLSNLATRCPDLFPDDDGAARQYLAMGRGLVKAGYHHYEISNFCRPGHAARHNTRYWLGLPVLAAGVAAHGQAGRRRWANVCGLNEYLARIESGTTPVEWSRRLEDDEQLKEAVMLGLRLARGVDAATLERCCAALPDFRETLSRFRDLGLVREIDRRVRLTPRGWLLSNELLATLW